MINEYGCLHEKIYPKGLPQYPQSMLFNLIKHGWLSTTDTVATIASGIGIISDLVSYCSDTVYAIEPDYAKRASAEARFAKRDNIISINATAENTTLPNESIDIIIVTEAFDCFEREQFKNECKRILKPKGRVVLVWNDYDMSEEITKVLLALNSIYFKGFRGKEYGFTSNKRNFNDFFYGHNYYYKFPNVMKYDLLTFLARNLSTVYAPKTSDECFFKYANELQNIFNRYESNGYVNFPYITRVYIGLMDDHIETTDILNKANRRKRVRRRRKRMR